MPAKTLDQAKAEAFAGRLLDVLNNGGLALMISVGHRTGLFDAMSEFPPATSEEIAQKAGLNERYVREWLGAMVTGRIVTYHPDTRKYSLPAEHAAFTTRPAGADNIAVFTQYISVLGNVEDEIVECFRNGGGVPYSKFPRFHTVMAEDSGQSVLANLESAVLPVVPGMIDRLKQGIKVLDVGCGSGWALPRPSPPAPPGPTTSPCSPSTFLSWGTWKTRLSNVSVTAAAFLTASSHASTP